MRTALVFFCCALLLFVVAQEPEAAPQPADDLAGDNGAQAWATADTVPAAEKKVADPPLPTAAEVVPEPEAEVAPRYGDIATFEPTNKAEESPTIAKRAGNAVDISVVVIARGSFGLLRNTLRAIRAELNRPAEVDTAAPPSHELIVAEAYSAADYLKRDAMTASLDSVAPDATLLEAEEGVDAPKLPRVFNRAAAASSGAVILFVDEAVEMRRGFLTAAIGALSGNVAVSGFLLLNSDATTVYHAGIEYSMGKIGRKYRFTADPDANLTARNVPLPYYWMQGHHIRHPAFAALAAVSGVAPDCVAVSRGALSALGGFDEALGVRFFLLDLSLRARHQLRRDTTVCARCVGVRLEAAVPPFEEDTDAYEDEAKPFLRRWLGALEAPLVGRYRLQNVTVIWNMECGAGQTLGFTTEAINFVLALRDAVSLTVEVSNRQLCRDELARAGWPRSVVDAVSRLFSKALDHRERTVLVVHRDPGRYRSFLADRWGEPVPWRAVGRSMFESDRLPADWVPSCNALVQRVWVPSAFNLRSFAAAGVNASRLQRLPEPIDTALYRPATYPPLALPGRGAFAFLTVSKWERRKGMDLLLRAYVAEFGSADSVSLHIRSGMDARNIAEFEELFASAAKEKLAGPDALLGLPPKPRLLTALVPVTKMPSLYAAADAFVLPTHGEGWGLPLIEAMAMGLPVIATNWSGCTEFLREDNANLVDVAGLVFHPSQEGHYWANPSIDSLRLQMRSVFQNRKQAMDKAKKAREFVVENFSPAVLVDRVLQLIRELESLPSFANPPAYSYNAGTTYQYATTTVKPTKIKINP